MRVHELAKQLGLGSKELVAKLRELGLEVKSHMSTVDEATIARLKGEAPAAEAAPASPAPTPEAPVADAIPAAEPAPAVAPEPKAAPQTPPTPEAAPTPAPAVDDAKVIRISGAVAVKDLADKLGMRPNMLVAELMKMNIFASINQRIDVPVARKVAEHHGFAFEQEKRSQAHHPAVKKKTGDELELESEDKAEDMMPRPPVVTFLGHVDHGKTSLLDNIRKTTVASGEHGGITQHIGAYTVDLDGRPITFLDTPGHAAFTAMRARGANLTDIAVIIIAADDGIMPQTREAISHAQDAGVTLMIAINKIDLPTANQDRVLQQLQEMGLAPEDWGGEVVCCPVSAETGDGIDHLLEMILLQAEMMELTANPERLARGFVVEGSMEPGMGPVADILITAGTLKIGDPILCGRFWGRVKALINDHGHKVKSATPATPIRCLGLSGVPEAGAEFRACVRDKWARQKAGEAGTSEDAESLTVSRKISLDSLFDQIKDDEKLELKAIIKADTQGSVEAIVHSLGEIKSEKIAINFVLTGTGNVTVNDVMLASASNAVCLGFHIGKENGVDAAAKHEGVEIRLHHVIYELIDQVRNAMTGMLTAEIQEDVKGQALIKEVYPIGKLGKVAGCLCVKGTINRKNRVRVKRGEAVLFEGVLASLKHFQDDVSDIREAQECGIRLEKFANIEEGDILEFYELRELEKTL